MTRNKDQMYRTYRTFGSILAIAIANLLLKTYKIDIPPMEREELREVIIKPAMMADLEIESDLVGDLLSEMRKQPEALPLLQFTLEELFYRREGRSMKRKC